MAIRLHQENPRLFLEAIRFTAAETGFIPRLIEKDYFCSVVLEDLAILNSPLTFKGGNLSGDGDIYEAAFENVRVPFYVSPPAPDGKLVAVWFDPRG